MSPVKVNPPPSETTRLFKSPPSSQPVVPPSASAACACCGADQRTDGSALAASSNGPDSRATSRATAHHGCGALALAFAGHGCTGGLNLMILPVDLDAGELESQRGAAFEAAGGLCLSHNALCASALRNGDLSFDFDRRFDRRCELVPRFAGFRANGLIQNNRKDSVSGNDQRFRFDGLLDGGLCRFRHRRGSAGVRAGLLISCFLASHNHRANGKSTER